MENGDDLQANDGPKHYSYDKEDRDSENGRVDKLRKERDAPEAPRARYSCFLAARSNYHMPFQKERHYVF